MNRDVRQGPARPSKALSGLVVGAALEVSSTLGAGFLEKVYERAPFHELKRRGLRVAAQLPVAVYYKDLEVGTYVADLPVEDLLLVELKSVDGLRPEHTAQCLNYLRATSLRLCLLFNYRHPRLEWKRIVL